MEAGVLREGRATFSLDLHPAYSNNALQGVQKQLDFRLLRWDDGLSGVLLAYKNLQRLPAQAVIRPYFPYIKLEVSADVLIFKPSIGAVLCGQVTKLGADFIGMVLMGSINAAVGRQNIRRDLRYKAQDDCWECSSNPLGRIQLGSDVLFSVEGLRIEPSGVLAVLGSMKQPWAGATRAAATTWPGAFPNPERWQNLATGAGPDGMASTPGLPGRLQSPTGTPAEQPLSSLAGQPQSARQQQQQGPDAIVNGTPGTLAKPASEKHQGKQNGPLKNDTISEQGTADQPSKATKKRKNGQANDVLPHVSEPPAGMQEDCKGSKQPTKRKKNKHKSGDSAAQQPVQDQLPAEQLPEQPRNGERLLHRSPAAAGPPRSPASSLATANGLPAGHQKQKKKKAKLKDEALLPGSVGKQANGLGTLSAPESSPVREEKLERKKKKKDKKNRVMSPHRTM